MDKQNRQGIGKGDKVAGGSGPGSDNPALEETYAEQAGEIPTADLLRARESAEEQIMRAQGAEMYADQSPTARPGEQTDSDGGRPNWPADRNRTPGEYMEAPRTEASHLSGSGSGGTGQDTIQLQGEADALADRVGSEQAKGEMPGGTNMGGDPENNVYAEREWGRPAPPSEMDMLAPGMTYLPTEEDDER